jgi:Cu/Zn superoxide dismutase
VEHTSLTLLPIHAGFDDQPNDTDDFTVRARMLNPYGGSGNRMGIVLSCSL